MYNWATEGNSTFHHPCSTFQKLRDDWRIICTLQGKKKNSPFESVLEWGPFLILNKSREIKICPCFVWSHVLKKFLNSSNIQPCKTIVTCGTGRNPSFLKTSLTNTCSKLFFSCIFLKLHAHTHTHICNTHALLCNSLSNRPWANHLPHNFSAVVRIHVIASPKTYWRLWSEALTVNQIGCQGTSHCSARPDTLRSGSHNWPVILCPILPPVASIQAAILLVFKSFPMTTL